MEQERVIELTFASILGLAIKLYALLTPTAVLSAFISYTASETKSVRYRIACKTGLAIFAIGEVLLAGGSTLFSVFGFTLDAFRIGVGFLLFLEAVALMRGKNATPGTHPGADISVVPLAVPLGMGPSTIGAVMVIGASVPAASSMLAATISLFLAALGITVLLWLARPAQRLLHRTGMLIMSKLTALLISAIAAQVIFTGIRAFLYQSYQ